MAGQVTYPRPGSVVGGKYVLESMLDSDASGAVFRARHASTGRPFAIRWLARSARTAVSAFPASHEPPPVDDCYQNPAVLSPLDLGRTPHGTYVVMEWLNGETLSARIACEGAMPLKAAAKLLLPCIHAVHDLHAARVVHGHLRPGNIFICRAIDQRPESVRVFDYSLARVSDVSKRLDSDGEYSRDAHFLAPEQIAGSEVDPRADVYAIGALLYLCVTGQTPFAGSERSDDFARWIYSQDPPALPGAPGLTPPIYRFLARAMGRDVCDRFNSCAELAEALEGLVRASPQVSVSVQPARVIRSSRPTMRLASDLPPPRPAANAIGSLRATLAGASVSQRPAGRATGSVPPAAARGAVPSALPPAADGWSAQAGGVTSLPIVSVPAPAAANPGSLRRTFSNAPTMPMRTIAQPPPSAAAAPPQVQDRAWPVPIRQSRGSSRPPAPISGSPRSAAPRWSPAASAAANSNGDRGHAHSMSAPWQPKLSINDSTLPLEVYSPRSQRRPLNRGAVAGSVCLALVGIVSTAAYFASPRPPHDALDDQASANSPPLPRRQQDMQRHAAGPALPELAPAAAAADLPLGFNSEVTSPSTHVAVPLPSNTAALVDDPSTPIDESDPLIAAALAELERKEVSATGAHRSVTDKTEPPPQPDEPQQSAVKRSARPAKSAAKQPVPASSGIRPAPAAVAGPEPAYKPLPAAGKMPWEIPAARKR